MEGGSGYPRLSLCSVNVAIQTGALPLKVRLWVLFHSQGLEVFSSFLFFHFFPCFLYTARVPESMRVCGEGRARLSCGPSYHIRLQP